MPLRCASCGIALPAAARFCLACGAPVAGSPTARPADAGGARKVVTIVFADLVGSTSLHERLDAESARLFMEHYYGAMRGAVEAHGGTVTQLLGDGVKAVFGVPRVAEDDAIRAVRAAVAMQAAFRELAELQRLAVGKTGLRVAVNTGEVVANDASEIIGDPVNVAARLQEQAREGDVVIGEATRRLVGALVTLAPLGSFALKGRTEMVSAYRVESLERPASATATAFVGREDELARIAEVYEAAIAAPSARLAVLLGSPGLGKSRLIDEFVRRLGDAATVVRAQCDAAGGASFAPLADALRGLPGIDAAIPESDAERARIVDGIQLLLAGSPASPEETFFVVRRLLAALASVRPLVLVIDDLHWAEPLLLDLIEHLVQWVRGAPLLVLAGARPELRDARSSLTIPGGAVAAVLTLAGLDAGAATRLAANVIGAADLPAAAAAKVLATSEGNPLFVGELVRMLVHEGALKKEGGRWVTGTALAEIEMPPTIHALLAARIERLRPEDRAVLERASVVGRSFSRSAVAELLPREIGDLDAHLESLRRSELIEPDGGWFLGEPAFRFHHLLIRDAAYRRLLKGTRAELHGRFAGWIEARAGGSIEHDETIGWHLEQAHQHLRELGPLDAHGQALGERAARLLAAAGRRALTRDDLPLAAGLLGRALARLDEDDPARAELALDWCEALLSAGDVGPAAAAIDELGRFTGESERLRAWHTCFAGQLTALTAPQALRATVDAVSGAAECLARLGDAVGEAKAHFVHAQAFARLGRVGACEAALDRALAAARRAGDRRRANAVLAGAPLAALWGPSPVTRASGRCLDVVRVLRISQDAPAVEAVALSCQGVLEALRGRTDAARRMIASSRKLVEELGISHRLFEADVFAGRIDLLEGDALGAERGLRSAYEGLRDLGLGSDAAQAAALLARALLAQGRDLEAESLSHESETLAGDDLRAAIAWRGVRAEALARRGEHAAAIELAEAAVAIAAATDALLDHADARLALAAALRASGRSGEADDEERRAIELWEAKGATLLAQRARREVARAAPEVRSADQRAELAAAVRRRVRPNAATANAARYDAAIAARDEAALHGLFAEGALNLHQPTGRVYDGATDVANLRLLFSAEKLRFVTLPLATLGDSLALGRTGWSASRFSAPGIDVGAFENELIVLTEVDAQGRRVRVEEFAVDRLGDAIARLFERYAELLAEGPERARAAATARSVATLVQVEASDPEGLRTALAPDLEQVDRRTAGLGSQRGLDAFLRGNAALLQLADGLSQRIEDIFDLRPDASLVRITISGIDRASGGAFERPYLLLLVFGADGLVTRWEQFDVDREAEALARFDELVAGAKAAPRRRVRLNAATENGARLDVVVAARDADALPALVSDELEAVDHKTGAVWDRQGSLASWRSLLRARDPTCRHEPLASLGDALALCRLSTSATGFAGRMLDVGAYEREEVLLIECDAQRRRRRVETFTSDHLGDAVVRLYERYAVLLPEGPERARAAATARSIATLVRLEVSDTEGQRTALAPDLESVDRRTVGVGTTRGAEAHLRSTEALVQLAEGMTWRFDDILDLRPDMGLVEVTISGIDRGSGGSFERPFLLLLALGADGLVTRWEQFDVDRAGEAFARFDELGSTAAISPPLVLQGFDADAPVGRLEYLDVDPEAEALTVAPPVSPFENAAARALHAFERCWRARDWVGARATYDDDHRMDDRRKLVRLAVSGEDFFKNERMLFESTASEWRSELLATRGERLALFRVTFTATVGSSGPMAVEMLDLVEVDAEGRRIALVVFDTDDADAAYAELDARFEAGEAAPFATARSWAQAHHRATSSRDWEAYAALCHPDLVCRDHRLLGWGTLHGPAAWTEIQRALFDLAPDVKHRREHVRISARGLLRQTTRLGTRDGGAFEQCYVNVSELDGSGRARRIDLYDLDQLDRALARFDEIGRSTPSTEPRFANAATRASERIFEAAESRDWGRYLELLSVEYRLFDRRRFAQLELDREQTIAYNRQLGEMGSARLEARLLATRGERLALWFRDIEVGGGDVGPSKIEFLMLSETNERGETAATVRFDADDLDAAYAELDARFETGEAAQHARVSATMRAFGRGWARRDWDALTALHASDCVHQDHRMLGFGTLVRDRASWIRTQQALVELAPDSRARIHHARLNECGYLLEVSLQGTREGGAFELRHLIVRELDDQGLIKRWDAFDPEQLDQAVARFEAIGSNGTPDPLRIPPNAATRALDRLVAYAEAGDWEAARELSAPIAFEDRRSLFGISGDCELFVANYRHIWGLGMRPAPSAVASAGERLALERVLWRAGDAGQIAEVETLRLIEVDAEGCMIAVVLFDPDARAAASDELFERYVRSGAEWLPATLIEHARALNAHDLDRMRAALPDDFVLHDHRRVGLGRLESADAYLSSLVALRQLSRDVRVDELYQVATAPYGRVSVIRRSGTNAEGGEFESVSVLLVRYDGDRILAFELFEVDDLDRARARLGELRPDPLRIAPNAAVRTSARHHEATVARDWDAHRALAAPDFQWEDRGRRALLSGGVELWISSMQFNVALPGFRSELELIGTIGDRLVLERMTWSGGPEGAAFENVRIRLTEVDASGRCRALILYDVEDRREAFAEAQRRFLAGEAAGIGGQAAIAAMPEAWSRRDWPAMRESMTPDATLEDHRTLGLGVLTADAWIEASRALTDLAPDVETEAVHTLCWNRHGRVVVYRSSGTNLAGGPFETVAISLYWSDGERIQRLELFDIDDAERAVARFEALCAARAEPP